MLLLAEANIVETNNGTDIVCAYIRKSLCRRSEIFARADDSNIAVKHLVINIIEWKRACRRCAKFDFATYAGKHKTVAEYLNFGVYRQMFVDAARVDGELQPSAAIHNNGTFVHLSKPICCDYYASHSEVVYDAVVVAPTQRFEIGDTCHLRLRGGGFVGGATD